jgi:hypothetical protein
MTKKSFTAKHPNENIMKRFAALVGKHVQVFTEPNCQTEGTLMEVSDGWLVVQEGMGHTTFEGFGGGLCFFPARRIIQFRAYLPSKAATSKKRKRGKAA